MILATIEPDNFQVTGSIVLSVSSLRKILNIGYCAGNDRILLLMSKLIESIYSLKNHKTMKRSTTLTAVALIALAMFFTANANAQSPLKPGTWRLGIGLEAGIPTGNASNVSSFELGGTGRLEYGADKDFTLMLTAGYYDMPGKALTGISAGISGANYSSIQTIPVKAGAKYFVAPSFYIDGEAGFGFNQSYGSHIKLIVSPGLGYDGKSWDAGLRYENFSGNNNSYGLIGLRLAYDFGL